MHIKSHEEKIARSANEVYAFLEDFRNFGHLLPSQVQNYQAGYDQCSFEISGMGTIALEMNERIPASSIKAVAIKPTAIDFHLIVNIYSETSESSSVVVELDAKLSMMLEMIAATPLSNFINMLAAKLKEIMESSQ